VEYLSAMYFVNLLGGWLLPIGVGLGVKRDIYSHVLLVLVYCGQAIAEG
jgi:hypothetical protein